MTTWCRLCRAYLELTGGRWVDIAQRASCDVEGAQRHAPAWPCHRVPVSA